MKMTKAELVESVQKALGKEATKRIAEDAVKAVLESIAKGVKKDKKVQLIAFGTFVPKKRAARMGRNPKTGESMKLKASKSVGFKPSSILKEAPKPSNTKTPLIPVKNTEIKIISPLLKFGICYIIKKGIHSQKWSIEAGHMTLNS